MPFSEYLLKLPGKNYLGGISVAITLMAYAIYIFSLYYSKFKIKGFYLWKGLKEGHALSWFQWGILTLFVFIIQQRSKGLAGSWVTGVSSIFCLAIAVIVAFKISKANNSLFSVIKTFNFYGKRDKYLFIAAIVLTPFIFFPKDDLWLAILATFIDGMGYISVYNKVREEPEKENSLSFGLNSIKYVFGIAAFGNYSIENWLYPFSLVILNGFIVVCIWYTKRQKRHEISMS